MSDTGLIRSSSARRLAQECTADERSELRNIGKRKLEEYRMLKQTLAGGDLAQLLQKAVGFSPTTTLALNPRSTSSSSSSGISAYRPDSSASPLSIRATNSSSGSSLATRLPTVSSEGEPSSSSSSSSSSTVTQQQRHRLAQAQDAAAVEPGSPTAAGAAGADPLTDLLLAQLQTMMSERQALQQQVDNLLRENEQLTELVGYLSSCQPEGALDGATSLSSQLSTRSSGAWWLATLPSAGSSAGPAAADGVQEGAEGAAAAAQATGLDTASVAGAQATAAPLVNTVHGSQEAREGTPNNQLQGEQEQQTEVGPSTPQQAEASQATTSATGNGTGSSISSRNGVGAEEEQAYATGSLQRQLSEAPTDGSDAVGDEALLSLPMPPVAQ